MVYKARLLLSGRQKIAAALLVLLLIAFFAYYPRITEAILAFLLGGEVPGTHIILSPDTVLAIVTAAFVVMFTALGLRWYFGRIRRNHTFVQIPVKTLSKIAIEVTTEMAEDFAVDVRHDGSLQRRHRLAAGFGVISSHIGHALNVTGIALARLLRGLQTTSLTTARGVALVVSLLAILVWQLATTIYHYALVATHAIAIFTAREARKFWRWAKPRLQGFDAWLEIRVRAVEARMATKLGTHETVRTVTAIGREYGKSMHELRPKAVIRTTRNKVAQIKTKVITDLER